MYRWSEERLALEFGRRIQEIGDDENPSLGGHVDLNNFAMYSEFTAAENMALHTLCYLNPAGKMAKANATTEALANTLLGMAAEALSTDDLGGFYLFGITPLPGFSSGTILYASTEAGLIQDRAPSGSGEIVRVVGYGLPNNKIYFHPDRTWLELETDIFGDFATFRNDDSATFRNNDVVEHRL